jgi:trans-aconitate methyltransferase
MRHRRTHQDPGRQVPFRRCAGIDSSPQMLAKVPQQTNWSFEDISIAEQLRKGSLWDLILANA